MIISSWYILMRHTYCKTIEFTFVIVSHKEFAGCEHAYLCNQRQSRIFNFMCIDTKWKEDSFCCFASNEWVMFGAII